MLERNKMFNENQSSEKFEQANEFVIADLETLRVITEPIRLQIVGLLKEPRTVKQVANQLKLAPGKLYYHFNLLEERNLIKVASTRVVSGIIEKSYQVAARKFRTDPVLLTFTDTTSHEKGLDTYLNSLFDATRQEIREGIESGLISLSKDGPRNRRFMSARGLVRLTPEQAETFYSRMADLIKEFEETECDAETQPSQVYGFLLTFYPTATPNPNDEEIL